MARLKGQLFDNKWWRRWLYPIAIALLVALGLYAYSLAATYKKEAAKLEQENRSLSQKMERLNVEFSRQETQFLESTANQFNYALDPENIQPQDAIRLAGHLALAYNQQIEPRDIRGYYRMLSDLRSTTLDQRDIEVRNRYTQTLRPENSVQISPFQFYRYEIRNLSSQSIKAPILYQNYRWDAVTELIRSAGFKDIPNETDRAIALWKFLSENRYHFYPVTEESEEHDIVKYLSIYGYGFCDDSARVLAKLADEVGLKGRYWGISGHVIPEVFADGKWIFLDPDVQIYFHKSNNVKDIYSVEELAAHKEAFTHFVALGDAQSFVEFRDRYAGWFMSTEDNRLVEGEAYEKASATSNYQIALNLKPGEKAAFANYNWGKYFLGGYPDRVPKYYNGFYEYALTPELFEEAPQTLQLQSTQAGFKVTNTATDRSKIKLENSYAFPIVGGEMVGNAKLQGSAMLLLEDKENNLKMEYPLQNGQNRINTDAFFSIVSPHPTFNYTINLILEPQAAIELENWRVTSDFQFAEFALLKLKPGENSFRATFDRADDVPVEFNIYTQ